MLVFLPSEYAFNGGKHARSLPRNTGYLDGEEDYHPLEGCRNHPHLLWYPFKSLCRPFKALINSSKARLRVMKAPVMDQDTFSCIRDAFAGLKKASLLTLNW